MCAIKCCSVYTERFEPCSLDPRDVAVIVFDLNVKHGKYYIFSCSNDCMCVSYVHVRIIKCVVYHHIQNNTMITESVFHVVFGWLQLEKRSSKLK